MKRFVNSNQLGDFLILREMFGVRVNFVKKTQVEGVWVVVIWHLCVLHGMSSECNKYGVSVKIILPNL